jgi:hypothetical protein
MAERGNSFKTRELLSAFSKPCVKANWFGHTPFQIGNPRKKEKGRPVAQATG